MSLLTVTPAGPRENPQVMLLSCLIQHPLCEGYPQVTAQERGVLPPRQSGSGSAGALERGRQGRLGPRTGKVDRLAPAQGAPGELSRSRAGGGSQPQSIRGGRWRVCRQRGWRLGRDLPLEGARVQRLHQAPLGCPRPVCPGSLQAISARPSPQTEAGTPGAHPSLLPQ